MTTTDNLSSIVVYYSSIVFFTIKEHKQSFIMKIKKMDIYSLISSFHKIIFSSFQGHWWKVFLLTLAIHRWCIMIELIYDCVALCRGLHSVWLEVSVLGVYPLPSPATSH